jgi:hypothetical protein
VRLVAVPSRGSDRRATARLKLDDRLDKPPSLSAAHSVGPEGISALHLDSPALWWLCPITHGTRKGRATVRAHSHIRAHATHEENIK